MLNEESKNAVNATCGIFREMTGQKMKISDNLNQKGVKTKPRPYDI